MQCNAAVVRRQRVEPQETAAGSTTEPSKTLFKNEKNTGLRGLYPTTKNVGNIDPPTKNVGDIDPPTKNVGDIVVCTDPEICLLGIDFDRKFLHNDISSKTGHRGKIYCLALECS